MRKVIPMWIAIVMIATMLLSACGGTSAPQAATPTPATAASAPATTAPSDSGTAPQQLPRNETLYIAGLQWQPPQNFNPLNGNPDWPGQGNHLETYETLFAYNQLTGNLDPLLAKELKVIDQTTMQITLQDGTKWQDGQALTADDVVYTYGLAKSQSDVNFSTLFSYITE